MMRVQIEVTDPRVISGIDEFGGGEVSLIPETFVLCAPSRTWSFTDGLRAMNFTTDSVIAFVSPEVLTEDERARLVHKIGQETARFNRSLHMAFEILDGRAPAGLIRGQ